MTRIVAPDSSGLPLLADLAAMRDAAVRSGGSAGQIEPLVPVDLIVDHSVVMDHTHLQTVLQTVTHRVRTQLNANLGHCAAVNMGSPRIRWPSYLAKSLSGLNIIFHNCL